MLVNMVVLAPHVSFDMKRAIEFARRVRPGIEVMLVSATRGDGMLQWIEWVKHGAARARAAKRDELTRLKQRIAELEAKAGASG
jgi:hydrogenase nickel incorporation protein HypB